jgi:hypothetical protein
MRPDVNRRSLAARIAPLAPLPTERFAAEGARDFAKNSGGIGRSFCTRVQLFVSTRGFQVCGQAAVKVVSRVVLFTEPLDVRCIAIDRV